MLPKHRHEIMEDVWTINKFKKPKKLWIDDVIRDLLINGHKVEIYIDAEGDMGLNLGGFKMPGFAWEVFEENFEGDLNFTHTPTQSLAEESRLLRKHLRKLKIENY